MEYRIKEERLTAKAYIDFFKRNGFGRCSNTYRAGNWKSPDEKMHEPAGREDNIIMYTCANANAVDFYEKPGMTAANDVMVYDRMPWTDYTVK